MRRIISVRAETGGYVVGRNGVFDITALRLLSSADDMVIVDGIGKRGASIRGGFTLDSAASMDDLAQKWLEARGYTVIKPATEGAPDMGLVEMVRGLMEDCCCQCAHRPYCCDVSDCSFEPLAEEERNTHFDT
jgi:hypothetical protein